MGDAAKRRTELNSLLGFVVDGEDRLPLLLLGHALRAGHLCCGV